MFKIFRREKSLAARHVAQVGRRHIYRIGPGEFLITSVPPEKARKIPYRGIATPVGGTVMYHTSVRRARREAPDFPISLGLEIQKRKENLALLGFKDWFKRRKNRKQARRR